MFRSLTRPWVKLSLKSNYRCLSTANKLNARVFNNTMSKFHHDPRRSKYRNITISMLVIGYVCSGLTIYNDRKVKPEELKNQCSNGKIWVVINGKVYDLTDFINIHPGGPAIIKKYAGKDASLLFNKIHAKDTIEKMLDPECYIGELDGELPEDEDDPLVKEEKRCAEMRARRPPLMTVLNLSDFEYVASKVLPANAWAYYSGGSDDEVTMQNNGFAFSKYFFKPKVLVDVDEVDISTTLLGTKTDAPFYCSAAASAKLGHPDGELSIARGLFEENIIQMISSAASYPLDDIVKETSAPKWYQLYIKPEKSETMDLVKHCEDIGIKAIFVTVDTALFGRREKDLRFKLGDPDEDVESLDMEVKSDFILSYEKCAKWEDIHYFKKHCKVPIFIKGVQRVEDVLLAVENGVDGVVLSNHGGRQLDFSRPPVDVLAELMPVLRAKGLDKKIDVYIDGGIRRGSDILKALCLGAKGVGLGRSFLYANSAYGENGVVKCCRLLKDELRRDMKLLGAKSLDELNHEMIHQYPSVFKPENMHEPLYLPQFAEAEA